MEIIYPYALIIHLVLAIVFLGYVFTDLAVLSALKDKFDKDTQQKINKLMGKRSFKIFPITLLFLVLTGGIMLSRYMNSDVGFLASDLQKILFLKILLAVIIVVGVLSNLYVKFTSRVKSDFMTHHFHKLVIVLGLFIVVFAKLMFLV